MTNIKFGIIGFGYIGKIHAHVINEIENATLVAISTRGEDTCAMLGREYNCETYTNYIDLLKRDDIDVVVICLPTSLHHKAVIDSAKAGKHIIVEKPIDIDIAKANSMIETCHKYGVKFSVILQHRFDRSVQLLKESVDNGTLGEIHFGTSKTIWYRPEEYFESAPWRGTWDHDGGGALMNQSIHYIDLLQYIMGPVEAVSAKCDTLEHKTIETEDVGVAILRFKNGSIGTIEGTTLAYPGLNTELNIFAEKGTVCIKNDNLDFYKFKGGENQQFQELLVNGDLNQMYGDFNYTAHKRQYEDFIDSIENNHEPLVTGEESKKALEIIKAIYKSSETNQWVII